MNILNSDQPGRILAVFIISPILAYKGLIYDDWFLYIFGVILCAWDFYWILAYPPKTSPIKTNQFIKIPQRLIYLKFFLKKYKN